MFSIVSLEFIFRLHIRCKNANVDHIMVNSNQFILYLLIKIHHVSWNELCFN